MPQQTCKLALDDGLVFTGTAFGATGTREGEVVINTAMLGYEGILADPAHAGQIVTMTYPQIGNVGVSADDADLAESLGQCKLSGFIVRDVSPIVSNFRKTLSLDEFLQRAGVIGITGIDTRALARHLRTRPGGNGVLSTDILDDTELVRLAQAVPPMAGRDLVSAVTPKEACRFEDRAGRPAPLPRETGRTFRVVAVDCGTKRSVLRNLVDAGCDVHVVPASASAEEILAHNPEGVFVSNGPGDPAAVTATVQTLRDLLGRVPMFGLGLGQLLLALAMGGRTFALPLGHRGGNLPVRNQGTGTVEITSQDHGFAADSASLAAAGATVTHVNLNDQTVEGFTHRDKAAFGVQYLPDAAPGPHDATYFFDCFRAIMATGQAPTAESMHAAQEQLRIAHDEANRSAR